MARPRKDGTPARQGLSAKQSLFLAYLPHAATPEDAALRAGYNRKNITAATTQLFKSPHIQAALLADMTNEGVNGRTMAKYMRRGFDAKSYSMTKEGEVVELGPDWHARYKMLELAAKLSGAMPDPRMEVTGAGGGAIVVRHTVSLDGDD